MILGFGVIVLGFIGAIGASLAAPLAVIVGGVAKLRGRGGLATSLLAWAALTAAAIVVMVLGLGGNAGHGVNVHGVALEDLLQVAPWALLAAAVAWLGFSVAARRQVDER